MKKLLILLLLFISCQEEYVLVKNEQQYEEVQRVIRGFNWEITDLDTFWNIDGKNILKYRVTYKTNNRKLTKDESDSLVNEIIRIFELGI